MENQSRFVVLFIIAFIIFVSPNSSTSSSHSHEDISEEIHRLSELRNSTFGHPGNVTDLGLLTQGPTPPISVRDKWEGLRKQVTRDQENYAVWRNAAGNMLGTWTRTEMVPKLNVTIPNNATDWDRNLTGITGGLIRLSIEDSIKVEQAGKAIVEVTVHVGIRDEDGRRPLNLVLNGVHFTDNGQLIATTTSERFAGLFALPHFTTSELTFNKSKDLLVTSLGDIIDKQKEALSTDAPWRSAGDDTSATHNPKCEFITYIQLYPIVPEELFLNIPAGTPSGQKPLVDMTSLTMRKIEHEFRFPTGVTIPTPPKLVASALLYSPTCGFVLETNKLEGEKVEVVHNKMSNLGLSSAFLAATQTWLLIRQMSESSAPSMKSRVSFWTIAIIGVVDGYFFITFMFGAIYLDSSFLPLFTAAFCHLVLLILFEMRFLISVFRVQRAERPRVTSPPQSTVAAPSPPTTQTAPGELPAPVTAASAPPVVVPAQDPTTTEEDETRSEISSIHTRFYFALVVTLFLTTHATSWSPPHRDVFLHTLLIFINSYWVPQIYRNIIRGTRKPLTREFVFGTSTIRLATVFYLYLYPGNIFHIDPRPTAVMIIVGWVWFQCCILTLHEMFGPRFLIPKRWLPSVYDYHRALPVSDEEAGIDPPSGTPGTRSFDCAICMQTFEIHSTGCIEGEEGSNGANSIGLLERRAYMVTPCQHVFHSPCLEGWMRYRLQCPICRHSLPAL